MDKFAGYILLEKISEKRNYTVYRGHKENGGHPCIIKLLKTRHPTLSEITRFKREYAIIQTLDISGIVKVIDLLEYESEYAIVEEDFAGTSLRVFLGERKLDCALFLRIGIRLSETLGMLHNNNIIHMNVKPDNILVHENPDEVKITDFGVSAALTHAYDEIYNQEVIEGSLLYMSPEQTGRTNQRIDYRTDLYSLGITFYEMLLGKTPFASKDPMEIIYSHIARNPDRLDSIDSSIPSAIAGIVARLLSKAPEERYQNSFGLMIDLKKCLSRLKNTGRVESFPLGEKDISIKFNIPQKIVDREKEIDTLISVFEKVNSGEGKRQMMLVSGTPGIGKTAIINEIQKPIIARKGYFISGKYDLFRRDVPYSAIIQAFQGLIKQILTENEEKINHWKDIILKAVGWNGKIITDIIPVIELLIGRQQEVPDLDPEQAQNRFILVFKRFMGVFTTKEHPLVLFLDDLQWADLASILFIKAVITDPDIRFFFLIGAYRDNEVKATHLLLRTVEEIKMEGVVVHEMSVAALFLDNINQLIANFLRCTEEQSLTLAEIIFQKTHGNPFFVNQFLKTLYDDHILDLNPVAGWTWDIERIKKLRVTDNVIELMAGKIEKLSPGTQRIMKIGACIGNRFDIETMAYVVEKSIEETYILLADAIDAGLVSRFGDIYKFYHDRIREAAYSLIPEDERARLHYKIGKYSLQNAKNDELHTKIIYIVDQINLAAAIITDADERNDITRLNFMAGNKAKASAAYESALVYYKTGISFLANDCWETQYDLSLSLYQEAAEAEYLYTRFDEIEYYAEVVKKYAKTIYDRIPVHVIEIKSLVALNKPREAVRLSLNILRLLGLRIPENPNKLDILVALLKIKLNQIGKRKENLIKLNEKPNLLREARSDVLAIAAVPAYTSNPALYVLIGLYSVNQSIKNGPQYNSALGYLCYAIFLCAVLDDVDTGYEFGQMALQLVRKPGTEKIRACSFCIANFFIAHWKNHLRSTLQPLLDAYHIGIETGDLEYAALAVQMYCIHLFYSGYQLVDAEYEMNVYYEIINKLKHVRSLRNLKAFRQVTYNLLHDNEYPYIISGDIFDEEKMVQIHIATNDRTALSGLYLLKIQLCCLFYRYREGCTYSDKTKKYLDASRGLIVIPIFYFYDSLLQLAVITNEKYSRLKTILRKVFKNQKKMKKWATHAPMNYFHKYNLVEAEIARVKGDYINAEELYDKAIEGAHINKYLQEEALANECAARFYLSRGKNKIASTYMNEAYNCYRSWGAMTKLKHLDDNYPQLLHHAVRFKKRITGIETVSAVEKTGYLSALKPMGIQALDISTIIKISLAISGEMNLGRLLSKIMKLVIENAGAQKGFMILEKEEGKGLYIEAESIDGVGIEVLQSIPVETSKKLSISIINYVKKTNEPVLLNDALREGIFTHDPYVIDNKPRSIFCVPIKYKGKTFGILYLENNLAPNAFIPEKLELLKILSSQAAISIENAILYERAIKDGLTKNYNKAFFDNYLMKAFYEAQQNKKRMSLLIIDIDDFKAINDTFGHQMGDTILARVAKVIHNSAGEGNITARYGGDEFAVVLHETGIDDAKNVAEKIRGNIEVNSIEYEKGGEKKRVNVTVSIGISELTGNESRVEFIERADKQMYRAKRAGKNKICP